MTNMSVKTVHKKGVFDILIVKTWEDGLVKSCHIGRWRCVFGSLCFSALAWHLRWEFENGSTHTITSALRDLRVSISFGFF